MSDFSRAAIIAADLIEKLEGDYQHDEIQIGEVMVIVEVTGSNPEDGDWTAIQYRCSDPRFWIHQGMLRAALRFKPKDLEPGS